MPPTAARAPLPLPYRGDTAVTYGEKIYLAIVLSTFIGFGLALFSADLAQRRARRTHMPHGNLYPAE